MYVETLGQKRGGPWQNLASEGHHPQNDSKQDGLGCHSGVLELGIRLPHYVGEVEVVEVVAWTVVVAADRVAQKG
jgi:hypothetical protein